MHFFERNPTALRDHPSGERMRKQMIEVVEYLSAPGAPPKERLRASLALFALHASWFVLRDDSVTDEERQKTGSRGRARTAGVAGQPSPRRRASRTTPGTGTKSRSGTRTKPNLAYSFFALSLTSRTQMTTAWQPSSEA